MMVLKYQKDKMKKHSLKLVAVRILPGCASYIQKCLSVNTFYYLCNDYIISEDGKTISQSSKHLSTLPNDFFSLEEKNNLTINLQAIVGKNGDGKSTLVEVVIRLINNLSYSYQMNPNEQLLYVSGVRAELYFESGGKFYCIQERSSEDIEPSLISIYRYDENRNGGIHRSAKLSYDEVRDIIFYTLVSNYSHYSYNTDEYREEWKDGRVTSDESDCWLQRVFHKNDGYQSPIGLHPYRSYGNIDVNKERLLSKSRLSTILLSTESGNSDVNGYWGLKDKTFYGLKLMDVGYSKLQKHTIDKFLNDHKYVSLLEDKIKFLKELLDKDEQSIKKELSEVDEIANAIRKSAHKYFRHNPNGNASNNESLFGLMLKYARRNHLLPEESDLTRFFRIIREVSQIPVLKSVFKGYSEDIKVWEKYQEFNLVQIQRIELIDDICDQWRNPGILPMYGNSISIDVSPNIITKSYSRLNVIERCYHYIIYKTISIFETYQEYKYPCQKYVNTALYFDGAIADFKYVNLPNRKSISEPFNMLSLDWAGNSHLTVKLQQTYSYCMDGVGNTQGLYALRNKGEHLITKDVLLERNDHRPLPIHQLPPAIYNWDLVFESTTTGAQVMYDWFSSGEKQKMNCLAAILYHVRNVNSITEASLKYKTINIILEEIELYFHPEWQRCFCHDLMGLLSAYSTEQWRVNAVNILFVTHSPYILSDIPKSNVLFLRDGMPNYTMQENTFGSNINGLLKNGFFLPSLPMGEFAHKKINGLFKKLHSGDFDYNELSKLYALIMTIGEPAIRHQLMTLYNSYKQLNENIIMNAVESYLRKLQDSEKDDSNQ